MIIALPKRTLPATSKPSGSNEDPWRMDVDSP